MKRWRKVGLGVVTMAIGISIWSFMLHGLELVPCKRGPSPVKIE